MFAVAVHLLMMKREMKSVRKKVGLLGGTFNPVHFGHLVLAREAMKRFGLDEILFIPCAAPPHKQAPDLASGRDRLAMLRAATHDEPRFKVLDIELKRGGVSYSIDTLRALKKSRPRDHFFFIIGTDMLAELHTWRDIYRLLELCEFVTMARPGMRASRIRIPLDPPWPERLRANLFRGKLVDIASRDIRARARRGWSIDALVPETVARYIRAKALYDRKEMGTSKR